MVLFRRLLGDVLRDLRMQRGLTLREVSAEARVSLGYISEIERGQKEASSELLASLCAALDVPLSDVLREVSDAVALEEAAADLTRLPGRRPEPRRRHLRRLIRARPQSARPASARPASARSASAREGWQLGHQYAVRSTPAGPSSPRSIGPPHRRQRSWPRP